MLTNYSCGIKVQENYMIDVRTMIRWTVNRFRELRNQLISLYDTTEIDWRDCTYHCVAVLAAQGIAHCLVYFPQAYIEDMDWIVSMQESVLYGKSLLHHMLYFAVLTISVHICVVLVLNVEYMTQYKRTVVYNKYENLWTCIRSGLLVMIPGEIIRYALCYMTYFRTFFGWRLFNLISHRAYLIFQWIGQAMHYEYVNVTDHWLGFTVAFICDSILLIAIQLGVYSLVWYYAERKYNVLKYKQ